MRRGVFGRAVLVVGLILLSSSSSAIKPTEHFRLADLEKERSMTPEKFADLFQRFFYELYPKVRPPEDFLWQRAGDCDDYAVLGAYILIRFTWRPPAVATARAKNERGSPSGNAGSERAAVVVSVWVMPGTVTAKVDISCPGFRDLARTRRRPRTRSRPGG